MKSELIKGDSLQELKKYDDNSVDLLCTDPPYGYSFMGRDWDKTLPPKEIFEECFRVLKPGSMAFVMSAPRSDVQYRMAEMLEKVGFRIDYTPIYWTYASGFPKAMNIGKMLDKRQGNKREEVEDPQSAKRNKTKSDREVYGDYKDTNYKVTKGSSELEGSYGGFQPKPAVEVVLVAMKPIEEKGLLAQAQKNGKAVSWFDDCRIPFEEGHEPSDNQSMPDLRDVGKKSKEAIGIDKLSYGQVQNAKRKPYKTTNRKPRTEGSVFKTSGFKSENNDTAEANPMGRFPANMLVSDEVLDDYSRFFSLDSWFEKNLKSLPEPVQQTFPFMIVPKASKAEKNNGLDNFDTKQVTGGGGGVGDYIDDVNSASGKFGSEKAPSRNIHPTVKPLTLMNYLVVLGSRKGDVVLDPFMGSGTTPLACVSLERKYIGIDNEEDYYEIAKARVDKLEAPIKAWEKFI